MAGVSLENLYVSFNMVNSLDVYMRKGSFRKRV